MDLQIARAIVIDDKPDEAAPVLGALNKLRVPSIYLRGEADELSIGQVEDVRMAFVDMDLIGNGQSSEHEIAAYTANFLAEILEDKFSLLIIFVWTTNNSMVSEFEKFFRDRVENIIPLFLSMETKPSGMLDDSELPDRIREKVVSAIESHHGVRILLEWEALAKRSVLDTTSTLLEIVAQDDSVAVDRPENISECISEVLVALGYSARELPTKTAEETISSIFSALNPILTDHMEARVARQEFGENIDKEYIIKNLNNYIDSLNQNRKLRDLQENANRAKNFIQSISSLDDVDWILNRRGNAPETKVKEKRKRLLSLCDPGNINILQSARESQLSRLNRMIHIARDKAAPLKTLPGNVYLFDADGKCKSSADGNEHDAEIVISCLHEHFGITISELIGSVLNGKTSDRALPFFADISPACDFALGKVKMSRVVTGCLVPARLAAKIPRYTEYLYTQSGLMRFDDADVDMVDAGNYSLTLNAQFQTGIPAKKMKQLRPAFRLRQSTLVDIQAWLARHGNRPGVITVVR